MSKAPAPGPRSGGPTARYASGWAVFIALNGLAAVAGGAFAAHALSASGPQEWARTAAQYQFSHALAIGFGLWLSGHGVRLRVALWLFALGIVFFTGSLDALALGAPRFVGVLTPVGGALFLLGWLSMALAAARIYFATYLASGRDR